MVDKAPRAKVLNLKQVIIRIAIIIALVELLIMTVFAILPWQFNSYVEALLDTIALAAISTPIIYSKIIKKFTSAHFQMTQRAEGLLADLNNYKEVIDQHAIIANTDLHGKITFVNQKFCDISQYTADELIGKNHRIINSGVHDKEFFKNLYKTIASGETWHGEICNKNKSGELYWVSSTIAPIVNSDGKAESYIAIRNDITEQKKYETEIKKALSLLEVTINSTDNGILVAKLNGKILQTNKKFLELWGIPEKLTAHADDNVLLEYVVNKVKNKTQFINKVKAIYANEYQDSVDLIYLKSGIIIERISKPMLTENKPMGRLWSFRDVTARVKKEEQQKFFQQLTDLKLSIAKITGKPSKFSERIEQSLSQLVTLDYIDDQHCAIVVEVVENNLSIIAKQCPRTDSASEYRKVLHDLLKEEPYKVCNGVSLYHCFIEKNQSIKTCYVVPLTQSSSVDNGIIGYLMVFENQAESNKEEQTFFLKEIGEIFSTALIRERARRLLKEASEVAEQSNHLKSEFLASMSHEIRTPMNGVLGMLGLLKQSGLTQEQLHKASVAQSSAESLLTLINDILDFSKVEAGKLELEILDFNLREMLGEFAESMAFRAQEKGIEIVLDVTEIEYSMVRGDPGRIRQILSNLVGNAIKFTDQGEIVIYAKVEKSADTDYRLTCRVQDTGIGIPTDKLDLLFDAFSQVDASTTRKYGGTGLGLSICKKLAQLMGGDISVSSELGHGSCFTFNINIELSQNTQRVLPQIDISELSLLIVDDNSTNREVLKGQLEHWGITVTEACSGKEALELCQNLINKRQPLFDIALLDMQMPEMDGEILGQKLQAHLMFKNIKLIMMTSISSTHEASYFAALGFHGFFAKPATTSDLFNALNVVMSDEINFDDNRAIVTHEYLSTLKTPSNETLGGDFEINPAIFRLLLVEDNTVNQMVARGILEKFGLYADVAANGIEAIATLANSPQDKLYDLVLMDCQMPEMDGYEATQQIRAGKAHTDNADIPIIAMTANAMQGDREKCIASGMNDYLAKPIEPSELLNKLNQWLPSKQNKRPNLKVISAINNTKANGNIDNEYSDPDSLKIASSTLHWDKTAVLNRIMGNESLLESLISSFNEEMPERIETLNIQINKLKKDQINYQKLSNLAHAIKGVSANLGAVILEKKALQLEQAAKQKTGNFQQLIQELIDNYEVLSNIFDEYITGKKAELSSKDSIQAIPLTKHALAEQLNIFNSLKEKLLQNDYIDIKELEITLASHVIDFFQENYQQLVKELEQFNFAQALETVEEITLKLEQKQLALIG